MALFKKKNKEIFDELDINNLPKHIGIIMDGNGEWQKKRLAAFGRSPYGQQRFGKNNA